MDYLYKDECLASAGLGALPEEGTLDSDFYRSICLCEMSNGFKEYIIAGKNEDGIPYGCKSFGNAMIKRFISFFPYDNGVVLDKKEAIKAPFSTICTDNSSGEWGVPGVNNASQAYAWVMANKKGPGNASKDPAKLKIKIQEILNH